jgi:hypothetical protein
MLRWHAQPGRSETRPHQPWLWCVRSPGMKRERLLLGWLVKSIETFALEMRIRESSRSHTAEEDGGDN